MKKKMILIDASGLLFRAFFAMTKNPLRTKDGQPTSAVFGFLRMIFNLIKKYPCHQIVAAFDVPRATLERTKQYSEYKATRKESPPDLIAQIPLAKECLNDAEITAIIVEGHEADDVLATLVKKYKEDFEIIIFTGDKDLLQLVGDGVVVALPDKSSPDGVKILDREGVKTLKGVYPEEMADYLAILGDTSDNVPGIRGIGEKGAVTLINEYQSLSNIYQNLENIKPTLAKKLEESKDNGFMSLELVRLEQDLDITLPESSENILTINHFVTEKFTKKLQQLELFSLLKELSNSKGAKQTKDDEVLSLFEAKHEMIQEFSLNTLDILSQAQGVGLQYVDHSLQFGTPDEVFRLDMDRVEEYKGMISLFFEALAENDKKLIVFDQKAIMHALKKYDIKLPPCDDVKIMAYLLDPARNSYTVEYLSLAYLGKNEITSKVFYELKQTLGKTLVANGIGKVYYNIEMPLRPLLFKLEEIGVEIDTKILKDISSKLDKQLLELEQTVYHLAGEEFNILSPKQLGVVLFEHLGLKPFKKTKTKSYSTDEESLEFLALSHPLPKEVLLYRSLSKFKSTYADALPRLVKDGRVHTTLNQTVTATGRLSSEEPNLQNIPIRTELGREIRKAFIAKEGKKMLSADYSQIELRLFASLSKDPKMLAFFESGGDVHRHTASEMFHIPESEVSEEQRRAAKTVNYGISYGMSAFRLGNELGIEFSEARKFIDTYFDTFPGVQQFMMKTLELASQNGFVSTKYGRIRPTPELLGKTPDKLTNLSHTSRFAINAVVQGTAADIIKIAMLKIDELIQNSYSGKVDMILQVHDELLFELDEACAEQFKIDLANTMSSVADLIVPLEVEIGIGDNWSEVH